MEYYDIFLHKRCKSHPDLSGLPEQILGKSSLSQNDNVQIREDYFLGLDLPAELAIELWKRLKLAGARSRIIPSRYRRQSPITIDSATRIAEELLEQEKPKHPPNNFGPLHFVREDEMRYTFGAYSREFAEQHLLPPKWFIKVDKIDGHIYVDIKDVYRVTLDTWFY